MSQNPNPNNNTNLNLNDALFGYFGVPNTPGSSTSSPIRTPISQQAGLFQTGQNMYSPNQPIFSPPPQVDARLLGLVSQLFTQFGHQQQFETQQQTQPETQHVPETQQQTQPETDARRRRHQKGKGIFAGEKVRCNKKMWKKGEEAWLAECWIDASEDAARGNSQRRGSFWDSVTRKFNNNQSGWVRGEDALSGKWRQVNAACHVFNGIYDETRRAWRSGQDDRDIYDAAVQAYRDRNAKDFAFKDCWLVVKDKPKWHAFNGVGGTSTQYPVDNMFDGEQPVNLEATQEPRINELFGPDPFQRPIGRDRARKSARSSASSDAATSSRAPSVSSMESIMSEYTQTMMRTRNEASAILTRNDSIRSAMQGTQFLATDPEIYSNARDKRRLEKMKTIVRREYREFIALSSDEDEAEDAGAPINFMDVEDSGSD